VNSRSRFLCWGVPCLVVLLLASCLHAAEPNAASSPSVNTTLSVDIQSEDEGLGDEFNRGPAERLADLFVRYGSMILTALFVVIAVLTALAGFSVRQSYRTHDLSREVLSESSEILDSIRKIRKECGDLLVEIEGEAVAIRVKVEKPFIDQALRDLATGGEDPASVARRYVAIGILREMGSAKHIRFLVSALQAEYEAETNKDEIRKSIDEITRREEGEA